jgi:hypothetical protein
MFVCLVYHEKFLGLAAEVVIILLLHSYVVVLRFVCSDQLGLILLARHDYNHH